MKAKMKALFTEEQGQGMTEYGLVLGVIAVAVVGALVTLRGEIVEMFQNVVTAVTGAETGNNTP
ncbi:MULTISPECIES: Flp family type IVb pilin [Mesobacillus]|uniref:Flp family type IVb pilin n=1 Tax=Mesobacillus selenatarsenatis TaxID=388741 RepID=A0A846U081_9BACI|nr:MULTISPECIES: Flp family type IVb pilin [Mesobacillus]NKE08061.1 Flp family type IVb pilin [Mesobacillus selenatarsenatis]